MTDAELVAKKLAFIETCVRELSELARPELLATDIREERFVVHTLQIAIQAALDVASHIVSDDRLGEPENNRQLFELLVKNGWVPNTLAESLRAMVGFRNIAVHGYQSLLLPITVGIITQDLDEFLDFSKTVLQRSP